MRFWLDLSTPKDVLFLSVIRKELLKRGHNCIVTTRKYDETNKLLTYLDIPYARIGSHGGERREDKLSASVERMTLLQLLISSAHVDALITIANPEACRVAFGLGIPVFNFIDMPEADKVCRLSLPLSRLVFTPFHVKRKDIRKYWDGEIYTYKCLDPVAWMPGEPKPLEEIIPEGVSWPFVIYREGETKASYYSESEAKDLTHDIVEELKKRYLEGTFYNVSRYSDHEMVDMQSLLAHADLFVGGGGTMNAEAAWWGTWTIACRPVRTSYDAWMEKVGLQYRVDNVREGVEVAEMFLIIRCKNKASRYLRRMKFPVEDIVDKMEDVFKIKSKTL